jgi:FAD/FMN-containing dehydrogenase
MRFAIGRKGDTAKRALIEQAWPIERRSLLARIGSLIMALWLPSDRSASGQPAAKFRRCRPDDPAWPAPAKWEALSRQVEGRLLRPQSPVSVCAVDPNGSACKEILGLLRNPFYIGDEPALTQASGWAEAWTSTPSAYAVAARTAEDVVAAVNFARQNDLRLVIKGGGHSYQGTSNAPDSLLIWTRQMHDVVLHDTFVAQGCEGHQAARPAVSVGAGAIWMQVYYAVVVQAGRYVQGGGCTTVGVAGLIQGGGFGSFSKRFGLACASLLEAEVITADGAVRIANVCKDPDLFWALKGGGGGTFGVVTRLTLAMHELPATFGVVSGTLRATSAAAYQRLAAEFVAFYADSLFNPHWGETVNFRSDHTLAVSMVFQDLDRAEADRLWHRFLDRIASAPDDYIIDMPFQILSLPARHLWDAAWLKQHAPGATIGDGRPDAAADSFYWVADAGQPGQFLYGYESVWLPASLLGRDGQKRLAEALIAATHHRPISLHFNKGLAGAPTDAIEDAGNTPMNPAVADAFALAITAVHGTAAYSGLPTPDLAAAREHAAEINAAMNALREVAPDGGSYVSESNYFEPGWQRSFWGRNYQRLLDVKSRYDPDGLFFVHHGVGSERWNADGFTRLG